MSSSRKYYLAASLTASAAAITLATNSATQAGGFALREQSAYGQGIAFAGIAAGGSLSSMFWNPATLSQVTGLEIEAGATGVFPITEVLATYPVFGTVDEGNIGVNALVPNAYGAYRVNDKLIVGIGVNGAFGLATEYPAGSPARTGGIAGNSEIFTINANPAVAFQINDYVTVAIGVQIQWLDLILSDQATAGFGIADLEADGFGYGLTAGIQIMPGPNTEIGLGYRSRIDNDIDNSLSGAGVPGGSTAASAVLDLPDLVTFGIRHRISDTWRVMAGVEWANWSRFQSVTIVTPFGSEPLAFGYEDGWFFSAGAEYMWSDRVTLRGGVGWETTPVSDAVRTFRLPDDDRLWLSAGTSYKANDRYSFDVGYTFLTTFDATIDNTNPANAVGLPGFATADVDTSAHILSVALKVRLGGGSAP
jgi:long-chain fatty acid transport protein